MMRRALSPQASTDVGSPVILATPCINTRHTWQAHTAGLSTRQRTPARHWDCSNLTRLFKSYKMVRSGLRHTTRRYLLTTPSRQACLVKRLQACRRSCRRICSTVFPAHQTCPHPHPAMNPRAKRQMSKVNATAIAQPCNITIIINYDG